MTRIEYWPWHEFVRRIASNALIASAEGRPLIWSQHPETGAMFWPKPTGDLELREEAGDWSWGFAKPGGLQDIWSKPLTAAAPSDAEYTRSTGERVKARDMPTPHLQSAHDKLLATRGPFHHELPGMRAELERRRNGGPVT